MLFLLVYCYEAKNMNPDQARVNMITQQLRTWNVFDERALSLCQQVPRELFVADEYKDLAFADTEIPVGHGQLMMPPKEEGHVLQAVQVQPHEKVLQIGAIGGYLTALLAHQAMHVTLVETYQELLASAQRHITQQGLINVSYIQGDINTGWQNDGPFDVIVLSGSVSSIPKIIRESLSVKGRLYAVVGESPAMASTVFHHEEGGVWQERILFETVRPRLPHAVESSKFIF
jgi:protein-L-isoaspartate(D-aspartate) O-methyltransferase